MYITRISECLALWGLNRGPGAEALMRCATDAAALTVEGEPWTVRRLCRRHVELYGGTVDSVELRMERALANAGVKQTVRSAVCILVGHALRDQLGKQGRRA